MTCVFVDTGAFIATLSRDDRYHSKAQSVYAALNSGGASMVTTNLVIAETVNLLMRKGNTGYRVAVRLGSTLQDRWITLCTDIEPKSLPPGKLDVVAYSTPRIKQEAWEILERYDTAGFSFTDCVSFAVMQSLGISKAFAFDSHFDVLGFECLRPDTKP